jgi:catechol 2,3-dioxygenase-like lactoylglutathione lyase family enzyme
MEGAECSCCGTTPAEGFVALHSHPEIALCFECIGWLHGQRAKQVAAQGGHVAIVGFEPAFSVADVDRAVEHYQRLGFTTDYHDETYAFAHRGDLTIHLAHDDDPEHHEHGALYLHVDDADQLAADWRNAGMRVEGPVDTGYGKREGAHLDPDGNLIRFGSPLPSA